MLVQALSLPLVLLPSVVIAHTHGNLPRPHHVARHGQLANKGRGAFDAELAPRQNSGVIGGLLDPNAESSAGQSVSACLERPNAFHQTPSDLNFSQSQELRLS